MVAYLPPQPLTFHVAYLITIDFIMFLKAQLIWLLQKIGLYRELVVPPRGSITIERSVEIVNRPSTPVDICSSPLNDEDDKLDN
ncbi:hypothetical protein GSI_07527 [Ganoderma sinense ZZ0214-1]|uniref:Uncharacterized protein n=1 Tax=Ganoderma sinense ZZ0214-1 TaxID=1077348 RepID=A0A2G8S9B0_9APHY|nr:hypothetical protein GSI_07527 [Ganoderma sinense ZZ0214-1]